MQRVFCVCWEPQRLCGFWIESTRFGGGKILLNLNRRAAASRRVDVKDAKEEDERRSNILRQRE